MASSSGQRKVIITCAITGAIHTPTMSPHLPVTSEAIAREAIAAAEAGAAIVHLHARENEDGSPTPSPERFRSSCRSSRTAAAPLSTSQPAAAKR